MAWFKVDDKLHKHKKARLAGCEAMGLWALAGSWVAAELTDGFVPESVCGQWSPRFKALAAKLVKAGLWMVHEKDGEKGWLFHDWHEYQPTAAKVRQNRTEAAARMRQLRMVGS